MIDNKAARKYSQALFELGKEKQKLVEYRQELEEVLQLLNTYDDFKRIFYHPRVSHQEKKEIIDKLFASKKKTYLENFLKLLVDKRRESYLKSIYREYIKLVNKEKEVLVVEVTSAVKLSAKLQSQLKGKLKALQSGKEIDIRVKVDEDLIAGLKLKIGDKVIDGSLKYRLNSLKDKIKQIPVSELGV